MSRWHCAPGPSLTGNSAERRLKNGESLATDLDKPQEIIAAAGLLALLGESRLAKGPAEGIYVRKEDGERLLSRAKLVRAEFVQAIDVHWTKKAMRVNSLAR